VSQPVVNAKGETEEEVAVPNTELCTILDSFVRANTGLGKIHVLQERFPLRLSPDQLRNCDFETEVEELSTISKETRKRSMSDSVPD